MGRLMLANWPPLGWSQVQTFGGTYSVIGCPFLLVGRELGAAGAAFQQHECNYPALFDRKLGRGPFHSDLISSTTGERSVTGWGFRACFGARLSSSTGERWAWGSGVRSCFGGRLSSRRCGAAFGTGFSTAG